MHLKSKLSSAKWWRWLLIGGLAIIVLVLPLLITRSSLALEGNAYSDCLTKSGASSVPAIQTACGLCGGNNDTTRRGTLWINNGGSKNSFVVSALSNATTVDFTLWGQVYACGRGPAGPMNAYSIWFAPAGMMKTNDPEVDFISGFSKGSGKSLYRGSTSGPFTWSNAGNGSGVIDIAKFKQVATCSRSGDTETCKYTVSVNRCSTKRSYVNETGDKNPGTGCYGDDSVITLVIKDTPTTTPTPIEASGDAHFYATSHVQVVNSESGLPYYSLDPAVQKNTVSSEPEDRNARLSFSTDNASVDLVFWHNIDYVTTGAAISLPDNLDGLVDYPAFFPDVNRSDYNYDLNEQGQKVYKPDGKSFDSEAYLRAVDEKLKELATTDGTFSQAKYNDLVNTIKNNLAKGKTYQDDDDYFITDVSTSWEIDDGSGTTSVEKLGSNNPTKSGTYTRSKSGEPKFSKTSGDLAKTTVRVNLEPGDTKLICQRIHYAEKNFVYTAKEITEEKARDDGTKYDAHVRWDWSIKESSDEGYSEACVEIHRAEDAGDFDLATGSQVENDNPYAGEKAYVNWNAFGESNLMLRMMGQDASVYLTNESVRQRTNGDKRSTNAPCSYYNSLYGISNLYYCHSYNSKAATFPDYLKGDDRLYFKTENFVTPDHTASKLCATFGFNYGRYYNFSGNYTGSYPADSWRLANSYWRVYDSSCRTIMKKPSVAIWNGSLMTPGGVKTSLSPRYDTQEMNDDGVGGSDKLIATNNGGNRTLYGSWSEHLDVVYKKVEGHTSGSALYRGHQNQLGLCDNNVNLTISNTGCPDNEDKIGSSGILNNSAYPTKLYTFLRDNDKFTETTTPVRRYVLSNSSEVMNVLGNNMTGTTIIKYTGSSALTIDHNITYNSTLSFDTLYDLPQVLIFTDGDINISSDVTRIDAWIIAGGTIDTCAGHSIYNGTAGTTDEATVYGRSGVKTCSKQLVFNGPVRAAGLKLNRTYGSDPLASLDKGNNYNAEFVTNGSNKSTKEAPAEIFNLRADTYLWAYAQAGRYDSSYTESYSRELPPRY